jgi:hypothetical protein
MGLLPQVVARAQDATQILQMVDLVARPYFAALPDGSAFSKYQLLYAAALAALNVGLRATEGATELNEGNVDDAFDDFAVAYGELMTYLGQHGLIRPDGTFGAGKPRVLVPDPLLLGVER